MIAQRTPAEALAAAEELCRANGFGNAATIAHGLRCTRSAARAYLGVLVQRGVLVPRGGGQYEFAGDR